MEYKATSDKYYVYILMRPDGRPFYVGKGSGNRVDQHEKEAAKGCDCHKCRVIRKVQRNGGSIIKNIVYETNGEADAYRYEAILIEQLGRAVLANVDEGMTGFLLPMGRIFERSGRDWNLREIRHHLTKNTYRSRAEVDREIAQTVRDRYNYLRNQWRAARRCRDDERAVLLFAEMEILLPLLDSDNIKQQQLPL